MNIPRLAKTNQSKGYQNNTRIQAKKNPGYLLEGSGIDFIRKATTYSPAFAVPSALMGLTSLFGMGRGGTPLL
jgi:hypothetical protein